MTTAWTEVRELNDKAAEVFFESESASGEPCYCQAVVEYTIIPDDDKDEIEVTDVISSIHGPEWTEEEIDRVVSLFLDWYRNKPRG